MTLGVSILLFFWWLSALWRCTSRVKKGNVTSPRRAAILNTTASVGIDRAKSLDVAVTTRTRGGAKSIKENSRPV